MRYKGGSPPLVIYTALRAAMICQAYGSPKKLGKLASGNPYCGLDKQKENFW